MTREFQGQRRPRSEVTKARNVFERSIAIDTGSETPDQRLTIRDQQIETQGL